MISSIEKTSHQPAAQVFIQKPVSLFSTIERIWSFFYECILKELGSCVRHVWYRLVFWMNPHKHGLNPSIPAVRQAEKTAKVVLMLHGAGAHPSSFIPLAKRLSEAKIENIFTVSLQQSTEDPVPIASLASRIEEVTQKYLKSGYSDVEFALVGHSLGGLVGSKYIWREAHSMEHAKVSMMISIAARLKYAASAFSWFCEDVKSEIEETFKAISKNPHKVLLYTIWGDRDAIVPRQSAHIQGEASREHTVSGWGHGGIVFAPDTHEKIALWIQGWLKF